MTTLAIASDRDRDLRDLVNQLGVVLLDERNVIASLKLDGLPALEVEKERLADAIHGVLRGGLPEDPTERAELLAIVKRVRNELFANSMLIAAALQAVRALLGLEEPSGYDRLARKGAVRRVTSSLSVT